jgi:hypothetical protein
MYQLIIGKNKFKSSISNISSIVSNDNDEVKYNGNFKNKYILILSF